MDRVQELEELIQKHNDCYWVENNPEITDEEYDKLVYELRILNPNSPIINNLNSVIPSNSKRKKVIHETPMLSLDKVYTTQELIQWCEKVSRNENEWFSIEPKFDGCSADFSNGILSTRGDDGIHGVDISDKIPFMTIESKDFIGSLSQYTNNIRGEIIIKKSTFKNYKNYLLRKDGKFYKIERNATVGLILQDSFPKQIDFKILTFISYDAMVMHQDLKTIRKMSWEFFIEEVKEYDYPTDGLVIKLYDAAYSQSLGYTGHHPKGQIALKYGNPKAESKLIHIIWQIGKNKLTPVGVINPIVLAGAEINKVTLHNAKFVLEKDICINDTLLIERSGEIIPHVIANIPDNDNRIRIQIDSCPSCNSGIYYEEPELICSNKNCRGKIIKSLLDSVRRLGLENIGEPTIEKLYNLGFTTLYQILNLTKENILNIQGFAEVSTSNLYNEIQRLKSIEIEDWKFLSALNINGLGRGLSKKILSKFTLFDLGSMEVQDLCQIQDIGQSRAIEIKDCMTNRIQEIINLLSILKIKTTKLADINISRKKICFTGKSDISREEWTKLAEQNDFEVLSSVTQTLDLLITNDIKSNSSKTNNAKKYGIQIITYDEFKNLVI